MNENELFQIQTDQVNSMIETIRWIADNPDKLIRSLRAKVATENAEYFGQHDPLVSSIFRGQDISVWVTNHVAYERNWDRWEKASRCKGMNNHNQ